MFLVAYYYITGALPMWFESKPNPNTIRQKRRTGFQKKYDKNTFADLPYLPSWLLNEKNALKTSLFSDKRKTTIE